jgi:hypothetical protein
LARRPGSRVPGVFNRVSPVRPDAQAWRVGTASSHSHRFLPTARCSRTLAEGRHLRCFTPVTSAVVAPPGMRGISVQSLERPTTAPRPVGWESLRCDHASDTLMPRANCVARISARATPAYEYAIRPGGPPGATDGLGPALSMIRVSGSTRFHPGQGGGEQDPSGLGGPCPPSTAFGRSPRSGGRVARSLRSGAS